jgi:hypothetical protein
MTDERESQMTLFSKTRMHLRLREVPGRQTNPCLLLHGSMVNY